MLEHQIEIHKKGFAIFNDVFSQNEIDNIVSLIDSTDHKSLSFRKTKGLFAIRNFLNEIPDVKVLVFSKKLISVIKNLFGEEYFVIKTIYFDKPEGSNWFVGWHQDLTIAVENKTEVPGYGPWTRKPNSFAVQPPIEVLKNNFTIRIHLDNTDKGNGALKVIAGSHLKNVYRAESLKWENETITTCNVGLGGIMVMRPLLMHASDRSINNKKRRVIHIEFSNANLPKELNWSEIEFIND